MPLIKSRLLLLPFALLIAGGLLLPAYGPLISSAYEELISGHSHVILSGTPNHAHEYEASGAPVEGDVLAVPGSVADGAIAVVVAAGTAMLALRATHLPFPAGLRRMAIARTLALLRWIALSPTAPPPKHTLSLS